MARSCRFAMLSPSHLVSSSSAGGGINEGNARYGRCLRRLAASRRSIGAFNAVRRASTGRGLQESLTPWQASAPSLVASFGTGFEVPKNVCEESSAAIASINPWLSLL